MACHLPCAAAAYQRLHLQVIFSQWRLVWLTTHRSRGHGISSYDATFFFHLNVAELGPIARESRLLALNANAIADNWVQFLRLVQSEALQLPAGYGKTLEIIDPGEFAGEAFCIGENPPPMAQHCPLEIRVDGDPCGGDSVPTDIALEGTGILSTPAAHDQNSPSSRLGGRLERVS